MTEPGRDLEIDLGLLALAIACALATALLARERVTGIRRELGAARTAREHAQQETAQLRQQLDGALEDLHRVAGERDAARSPEA